MNLTNLPDVPLLHIFGYLEIGDVATLSSIHRRFDDLTGSQYIWFDRCWNSLNPFWMFKKLPIKESKQSFQEYFKDICKIATHLQIDEYDYCDLKIGNEKWHKIDDKKFKNDVWKMKNWSPCISIADGSFSGKNRYTKTVKYGNFVDNILLYKRRNFSQNSNGPDERLSTVMMNDLLKIFKNYVASSDKYMDNCKFELLFHDKETFRHHFEKCPLFSANVFIESPSSWLLFFSMLITEYLEPVVKSLILRRVIEFHEVRDMLSTVLQNSISETFQNIYTIHSYCEKASFVDYVTEYLYYRLCMGYDVKEHRDDSLTSDILYKLLSNVRKMLSDAINERNKNHSSIDLKLKTNHDDFLQEKMNNFQRASHRFDKNNLAAFFRCYLKEKASKAQEELSKYIECFFFKENETKNLDKKGKTSSESAVHVYFLTGVGSDDVYKSQAVTLLVNYRYAIMILEHVNMSVSLF